MKKLTLFILCQFAIILTGFAQIEFSSKRDTCILENGVEHKAEITLYNNTSTDYGVSWRTISSTLLDNDSTGNHWNMQYCECNLCYANEFKALPTSGVCGNGMPAGTSKKWYLTVDPAGNALVNAEFVVEVTNTTTKERDTLTYVVLSPNSVIDLVNYGTVSAFPNPVKNELNIQYSLQNVTAPEIVIYNTVGTVVKNIKITDPQGTVIINTSNLQNGMYFYVLRASGKQLTSDKFNVVH